MLDGQTRSLGRRSHWQVCGGIAALSCLLQFLLQAAFFPLSALSDSTRVGAIDAPYHQYQLEVARDLCRDGLVAGYEPRFLAGAAGGVTLNASAKVPGAIYCAVGQWVSAASVYKHFSFWSGVAAPALIVLACGLLGVSAATTLLAGLFACLLWWVGPLRWYHTAGMVSWVLAAYAIPAFVAAFWRWGLERRPGAWMAIGLCGAFGFLLHPLFVVAAVLFGAPVLAASWPKVKPLTLLASVAVVGAVTLLPNLIWILPSISTPGLANADTPYQRAVEPLLFAHEMLGRAPTAAGGSKLYLVLVLGALFSMLPARKSEGFEALPSLVGAALLMAWASLAGWSGSLALLQPNRFSALAWLTTCVPAAAGFVWAGRSAIHSGEWRLLKALLLAAALGLGLYYVKDALHEALAPAGQARVGTQPPESRSAGAVERSLASYLRSSTSADARVLFETSLGRIHDGGHGAGLLAYFGQREFIGGPYPFLGSVNFWDGTLMGRPILEYSEQQLARLLTAYNVGWILCHTAACKEALSRLPDTLQTDVMGPVTAFRRQSYPGFVASGLGVVTGRCTNRVEVESQGGGSLVLRYHWVPALRSVPSGEVRPIVLANDLAPFVEVRNPPPRFSLRLGSGDGQPCDRQTGWPQ